MDIYRPPKMQWEFQQCSQLKGMNSDLNEDTPFITADGKTIYFSSQDIPLWEGMIFLVPMLAFQVNGPCPKIWAIQ